MQGDWRSEMAAVTRRGLRVILSSPWYLNYIRWVHLLPIHYYWTSPLDWPSLMRPISNKEKLNGPRPSYGSDWTKYYLAEPLDWPAGESQSRLVVGGETCMWDEHVNNVNLTPRQGRGGCRGINVGIFSILL